MILRGLIGRWDLPNLPFLSDRQSDSCGKRWAITAGWTVSRPFFGTGANRNGDVPAPFFPDTSPRRAVNPAAILLAALVMSCFVARHGSADPLPSWREGAARQSIVEFVQRVTSLDSPEFVPPEERIAVFDNDGTLWSEQPIYFQLAFALDRVKAMATAHPEWKQQQPFQAVLEDDLNTLLASGHEGLAELVLATHSGMMTDEFSEVVREWIGTARHPQLDRRYVECVYQPMVELLVYLRENGFKTWIVSGGGVEFMRAWVEGVYGVPPEQVVGSTIKTEFALRDGSPALIRLPAMDFINDKAGKPVGINRFIGRRPIAAFGNSDGDLEMLQWAAGGDGASLCMIVHHTDDQREWAYDRESHIGRLDKALDEGRRRKWTIVDMRRDWKTIHTPVHHYLHKSQKSHAADWSYSGATGPAHWSELDPDYVLAKTGRRQSPIDIRDTTPAAMPRIAFDYKPSRIHLIYNGHTIQENEDPGSFSIAENRRFELQQFHFHSPSEHTVDGNHFPMELHLVHKSSDGQVGVVAVFVREGEHNHAFDGIWSLLPDESRPVRDSDLRIDTMALLPKDRGYYSYDGSFTTPPCTERVKWVVLRSPISLSPQQIRRFRRVIDGNNRPVQPRNGRPVLRTN